MNYVYKHPRDMEPIERERYFIKHFSNAILEKEEHKKDKDDYWARFMEESLGKSCWDEQIAFCKKRISEARVRLAALEQAQRDSSAISKTIDKKLGITDE